MNPDGSAQLNLDQPDSDGTFSLRDGTGTSRAIPLSDLTFPNYDSNSTTGSNSNITVDFYGSNSNNIVNPDYHASSSSSISTTLNNQDYEDIFNTLQDVIDKVVANLKVEEGDDSEGSISTISFDDVDSLPYFSYDGPTCYYCNGYYGLCYGDPTCDTCHTFLYPNGQDNSHMVDMLQSSGDSDSGNDEPVESEYSFRPQEEEPVCTCGFCEQTDQKIQRVLILQGIERLNNPIDNRRINMEQELENNLAIREPQVNIDEFPPEILMHIFQYLDELSLWSVGQVNIRWKSIIKSLIRSDQWREFIYGRWPLLYISFDHQDFYELYTSLIESCCCLKCIKQMIAQEEFDVENNSWRKHRLRTELRAMQQDPLEGIYAYPLDPLCCHWQASIQGPSGSPYEGGLFFMYIQIPHTYPMGPPVVRFLTKILHPNISRHGDIGIDSIHHNWSLALIISKVLISIQSLLTDPNCEVCMEPAIGALYMENRPCFDEQARLWTWKYAMHGLRRH